METKKLELSFGTVEVRGMNAGEATLAANTEAAIKGKYSDDVVKMAEELTDLSYRIMAKCVVCIAYPESNMAEGTHKNSEEETMNTLMQSTPDDIARLNSAIMELTGMPEGLKKNLRRQWEISDGVEMKKTPIEHISTKKSQK